MRVLGIDCGGEYTGYAVVEQGDSGRMTAISYGAIRLKTSDPLESRLLQVWNELRAQIEAHHPEMVAIEDVFYGPNAKSMLKLGEVRGVAMLAASSSGLTVAPYAPLAVKSAVVGYGKAEKSQVQHMVTRLLNLPEIPHPPDAADALAIAMCHLNTWTTLKRQAAGK
jgi:crossover junction endodeoxyribonuclease RuvC